MASVFYDFFFTGHQHENPINAQLAASCLTIPRVDGLNITNVPDLDLDVLLDPEVKAILFFSQYTFPVEEYLKDTFGVTNYPVVGGFVNEFLSRDVGIFQS